ncbi:MAG: TetR/AcrR family transcriptional regulator [Proteobacteria bacterium]|nr:TetR/AcrR family transcriptional regulator [Pseudomonadota bacterium]
MPRNAETTRRELVAAAEKLFSERGIDSVSLREINRAAGQRNATALQYHFTDRDGLVRAVLHKHHGEIEARRHALLDAYDQAGRDDLRELTAALVLPLAAKLDDRDGGREYLRVLAQLLNRPDPWIDRASTQDPKSSVYRWRKRVAPLLPEHAADRLHRRFTALRILFVELARRAESPRRRDERLFVSHLVDLLTAILAAPLSDETERLLEERQRGRGAR